MSLLSFLTKPSEPEPEPEQQQDASSEQVVSNASLTSSLPPLALSKSSILSSGLGQLSDVNIDNETYQLNLDVRQFTPEEISVKTADGFLLIEAGHVDELEENSSVIRRFAARYALPAGCNTDGLTSFVNSEGILTVTAPLDVPLAQANVPLVQSAMINVSEVMEVNQPTSKSSQTSRYEDTPDPVLTMFDSTNI